LALRSETDLHDRSCARGGAQIEHGGDRSSSFPHKFEAEVTSRGRDGWVEAPAVVHDDKLTLRPFARNVTHAVLAEPWRTLFVRASRAI
jgi:hypothetical protein